MWSFTFSTNYSNHSLFWFWKKCVPDIFVVENCQQLLLFQQYELQTTHFYAYPLQIIRQDCLHSEIDANFILAQYSFLQKCFWNSLEDITYRRYSSLICFHFLWCVLSKWREIRFRFFFFKNHLSSSNDKLWIRRRRRGEEVDKVMKKKFATQNCEWNRS